MLDKRDDGARDVHVQRLGEAIRNESRDVRLEVRGRATLGGGRRCRSVCVVVVVRRSLCRLPEWNQVSHDRVRVDLRVLLARILCVLDSVHGVSDVPSRYIRKCVERDRVSRVRARSLRDVSSIIFMRYMLAGYVRFVGRIERVHSVCSGPIRIEFRCEDVSIMSERDQEQFERYYVYFMHKGYVLLESYGSDDVFDVRSRPIRAAGECDVVRRVSERDQEHSGR